MRRWDWDRLTAVGILIPSVIAVGVFVYGFILWTGWVSLSAWDGLLPDFTFVGLRNYVRLFRHPRFHLDIRNTLVFTVFFISLSLAIGLLLAVLLDRGIRGENVFRSIYLFPMAISFIVTGVVWRWLFNPEAGINLLLRRVGLGFLAYGWFTDPTVWYIHPDSPAGQVLQRVGLGFLADQRFGIPVAMFSVIIAATWQMSGFVMALYLAGLRGIPDELREAARVDGATEWQVFRFIILPLLRPVTLSAVIILGHISLKIFDLVAAMSKQGPGFVTDVPAFFMYQTTFHGNHFAQGAAIAIFMLVTVSLLVVPYLRYSIRGEAEL